MQQELEKSSLVMIDLNNVPLDSDQGFVYLWEFFNSKKYKFLLSTSKVIKKNEFQPALFLKQQ